MGCSALDGHKSEASNCIFLNNEIIGLCVSWGIYDLEGDIYIHDNYVGISENDKVGGNENGIYASSCDGHIYIYDNVVCGNEYGITILGGGNTKLDISIYGNYIGVNKKFDGYGNSEAGIKCESFNNRDSVIIGLKEKKDYANFIGYNKKGIVCENCSVLTYNNYIGVTPNFHPMPNDEVGVLAQSVTSEGNYIGFNGTNGMEVTSYSTIGHDYIGGDGIHSFPNEEYGVYGTLYGKMTETQIFDNKKGGVMLDYTTGGNPGTQFEYSQCLFGGDQPFAVKRPDDNIPSPVIKKVYSDDDYIYIEGTVELLEEEKFTSATFVAETEVTIELFSNDGGTESALRYLGSTVTDAKGKWLYKLEKSKYADHIVATATHQCHQSYSEKTKSRYTSRF